MLFANQTVLIFKFFPISFYHFYEIRNMLFTVAPIHKFLGGGGKIFYGIGEIFFAPSCQKPRISTPTEVNSCTKMY